MPQFVKGYDAWGGLAGLASFQFEICNPPSDHCKLQISNCSFQIEMRTAHLFALTR
jgi:hypothetical protein